MPLGKKVRPSTAVGRLETYNTASIFHNAGPASAKSPTSRISCIQARARTSIPESRAVEGTSRCPSQSGQTEWLETETEPLKHHPRRHSVGLGQSVATNENIQRFGDTIKSLRKGKIEQHVSLTHLKSIQAAFEESRHNGRTPLDVEDFKMIMKKCLGYHAIHDDQIEELFRKIDYSADGQIEWDEFCTYMQLKYKRIEESYVRSKHVSFSLPATFRELSHAELILRIYFTPDQSFIMMREDGTISFWSAQLKLKRSKRLFVRTFGAMGSWKQAWKQAHSHGNRPFSQTSPRQPRCPIYTSQSVIQHGNGPFSQTRPCRQHAPSTLVSESLLYSMETGPSAQAAHAD